MGRPSALAPLVLVLLLATCARPAPSPPSPTPPATTGATTSSTGPGTTTVPTSPGPSPSSTSRPPTTSPTSTTSAPPPTTATRRLRAGADAWVAVSVATLWRTPSSPRGVDAPALENPARIRVWLRGLGDDARRGLDGRADTQALLGDRVVVTRLTDGWAKVVVPSQPTPLDGRGYPGWVPRRQLTPEPPRAAAREATVVSPTAWLRTGPAGPAVLEVSLGTRLPRTGEEGTWVQVVAPPGRLLWVAAADVSVTARGAPALPATGRDLARTARLFTGLPYLWAGTSGFGLDCSGLTFLVHRVHGVTLPRDAAPQSTSGAPVPPADAVAGDVLFFARDGVVHHVALSVGDGLMTHAPHTGASVETIPVSTPGWAAELGGARRFVG